MLITEDSTIKNVKNILQFYEHLKRLEVLNEKIKSSNDANLKNEIIAIKGIEDEKERWDKVEYCFLRYIQIQDEMKINVSLHNETLGKILAVFKEIILAPEQEKETLNLSSIFKELILTSEQESNTI